MKRTRKKPAVRKTDRRARRRPPPPSLVGRAVVNLALLQPSHSYGEPDFVKRGYYRDEAFTCRDCGKKEIWTATQQKWWYEIAKGDVWTTAIRCRPCRRRERERREEARRIHLAGVLRLSGASESASSNR